MTAKRGRPKGATRYRETDHATLTKAAGFLLREVVKTPTAAFRKAGAKGDAEIRRLRGKWSDNPESYLAEAKRLDEQRKRIERNPQPVDPRIGCSSYAEQLSHILNANPPLPLVLDRLIKDQERISVLARQLSSYSIVSDALKKADRMTFLSRRLVEAIGIGK